MHAFTQSKFITPRTTTNDFLRVCVFGTGEEEKEVGIVEDLSASSSFGPTDTHSGFVHGITDHDAPSLVVYFWE